MELSKVIKDEGVKALHSFEGFSTSNIIEHDQGIAFRQSFVAALNQVLH